MSDNGGLSTLAGDGGARAPTANRPLRAGKGWLLEGGIRIPLIIRWPPGEAGRSAASSDVAAMTTDLFPTLLSMAGIPLASDRPLDGIDLTPAMTGGPGAVHERDLFWHFPHYHGSGNRPGGAVLSGDYKLVEWFEYGDQELYDLAVDPGERVDLADSLRAETRQLAARLASWRDSVGARMPRSNPEWKP